MALPVIGNFINENFEINHKKPIDSSVLESIENENNIYKMLTKDKSTYLASLKKHKISFHLGMN